MEIKKTTIIKWRKIISPLFVMQLLFFIISVAPATNASAQQTFEKLITGEEDQLIRSLSIDSDGNYILIGGSSMSFLESSYYILKLDIQGNILNQNIFPYSMGKYQEFQNVFLKDNYYYIIGRNNISDTLGYISFHKLDHAFDIVKESLLQIPSGKNLHYLNSIIDSDDNFVITGFTHRPVSGSLSFEQFLYKLNPEGDSINSRFWHFEGPKLNRNYDLIESDDQQFYYTFGDRLYMGGQLSRIKIYDKNFDSVSTYLVPYMIKNTYSPLKITDSSTLIVGQRASYKLGVATFDSLFNEITHTYFQKDEEPEYTAILNGSSKMGSNIYVGGTSDFDYSNYPFSNHDSSWYHLIKINPDLTTVWEKWYGGDAYYVLFSILATEDGGCIMVGTRYDSDVQNEERDIYIVKVDSDGLITWEKEIPIPQNNALVYPNPGKEKLNLKTTLDKALFQLTDMKGRVLIQQKIQSESTEINTNVLLSGAYLWTLSKGGKVLESGKWVKE